MRTPLLAILLLLSTAVAGAQETFPGLKSVLTEAEWKRAGLDRLSPDELGVIDAAMIRHLARTTAQVRAAAVAAAAPAAGVAQASNPNDPKERHILARFGLPVFDDSEWRTMPPMRAKALAWEGGNRFRLDNGQVWEAYERLTYDIINKPIEIQARPHGQYVLIVDGANTTVRVLRLR